MDRPSIVAIANAISARLPRICVDSSREALTRWLQAADPNGCHTDYCAECDGMDPHTLESAWEAVAAMVSDV